MTEDSNATNFHLLRGGVPRFTRGGVVKIIYKMTSQRKIINAKVLVTGGAGFIGSNLVDCLLEQNNKVICLDNFSTGKRENLELTLQNPNFTLIEGDIRNYNDCQKAVEGCDYVLHQAALGSVPRSIADPMTSTDVNIGGL